MYKSLVVGSIALLAAFAVQPDAARAGAYVDGPIGKEWSPSHYYPDDPVQYPGYRDYDDDDEDEYDYISCREGRRIVRRYGFRQVAVTRCGVEVYKYRAVRRNRPWIVRLSARSGRIISARPLYGYGYY
jgi:hypothetical protein